MKEPVIYRIRNKVNGKVYIGSTNNRYVRWKTHKKKLNRNTHHCHHLQAAWNKYGAGAFAFEVIEKVLDEQNLQAAEDRWLSQLYGLPECYNVGRRSGAPWRGVTGAAHPNYGKPMSEEQKAQLREAATRQWAESDPRTGRTHSDEAKAKISAKVQAALAEGRGGKFIPSEETRKKMSEALRGNQSAKGYKRTKAEKDAIAERMRGNQHWLGKTHSEESKAKMGRAIVATAPDGTQTTYPTITALREALSLTPPTVHRALESGKPLSKGRMAGWGFAYA